jgi:DNA-binding XRE family transcriptional regulator
MKKPIEDCIKEGRLVREYRKLMGMKQLDMAKILGVKRPNYCNMEKGSQALGDRFLTIQSMFIEWKKKEIERLEAKIKFLKSL